MEKHKVALTRAVFVCLFYFAAVPCSASLFHPMNRNRIPPTVPPRVRHSPAPAPTPLATPPATPADNLVDHTSIFLNDYPIVLLPGLAAWSDEYMNGFSYWGMHHKQLLGELRALFPDRRIVTVFPSAFASTLDRACEIWAMLKGLQVQYGSLRVAENTQQRSPFVHATTGRNYTGVGLYPEWDEQHPVHIIAHSSGGLDARKLVGLLRLGNQFEYDLLPEQDDGSRGTSLFKGGRAGWIASITTIGTPHDGTDLDFAHPSTEGPWATARDLVVAYMHAAGGPLVEAIAILTKQLYSVNGNVQMYNQTNWYDFGLHMWQDAHTHETLGQRASEPWTEYALRVLYGSQNFWTHVHDHGLDAFSIPFAASINDFADRDRNGTLMKHPHVDPDPDIFYFTYSLVDTATMPVVGTHVPDPRMFVPFIPIG